MRGSVTSSKWTVKSREEEAESVEIVSDAISLGHSGGGKGNLVCKT